MIKPTPGRVVWFHPSTAETLLVQHDKSQPLAATVAYVWTDRLVNLSVVDQNGVTHPKTSVPLLQDGDGTPPHGYFAEWMPFQKGQAANADTKALPPRTP